MRFLGHPRYQGYHSAWTNWYLWNLDASGMQNDAKSTSPAPHVTWVLGLGTSPVPPASIRQVLAGSYPTLGSDLTCAHEWLGSRGQVLTSPTSDCDSQLASHLKYPRLDPQVFIKVSQIWVSRQNSNLYLSCRHVYGVYHGQPTGRSNSR